MEHLTVCWHNAKMKQRTRMNKTWICPSQFMAIFLEKDEVRPRMKFRGTQIQKMPTVCVFRSMWLIYVLQRVNPRIDPEFGKGFLYQPIFPELRWIQFCSIFIGILDAKIRHERIPAACRCLVHGSTSMQRTDASPR